MKRATTKAYWINANLNGTQGWHLAVDLGAEIYFPALAFSEEMSLDEFRSAFPNSEVVGPLPSPHECKMWLKWNKLWSPPYYDPT